MAGTLRVAVLVCGISVALFTGHSVASAEESPPLALGERTPEKTPADLALDQFLVKQATALTASQLTDFWRALGEGKFDEAGPLIDEVVATHSKLLGNEHWQVKYHTTIAEFVTRARGFSPAQQASVVKAMQLRSTAETAAAAGKVALAEEMFKFAATEIATSAGTDSYLYVATQLNFAVLLVRDKRFAEAVEIVDQNVAACRGFYGDHSEVYSTALHLQGLAYLGVGRTQEAAQLFATSAWTRAQLLGTNSAEFIQSRHGRAAYNLADGKLAAAEKELNEVLELCRSHGKGDIRPFLIGCLTDLAEIKLLKAEQRAALELATEALPLCEIEYPTDSVWTAQVLELQGRIHTALGDAPAAKLAADRAGSIRLK